MSESLEPTLIEPLKTSSPQNQLESNYDYKDPNDIFNLINQLNDVNCDFMRNREKFQIQDKLNDISSYGNIGLSNQQQQQHQHHQVVNVNNIDNNRNIFYTNNLSKINEATTNNNKKINKTTPSKITNNNHNQNNNTTNDPFELIINSIEPIKLDEDRDYLNRHINSGNNNNNHNDDHDVENGNNGNNDDDDDDQDDEDDDDENNNINNNLENSSNEISHSSAYEINEIESNMNLSNEINEYGLNEKMNENQFDDFIGDINYQHNNDSNINNNNRMIGNGRIVPPVITKIPTAIQQQQQNLAINKALTTNLNIINNKSVNCSLNSKIPRIATKLPKPPVPIYPSPSSSSSTSSRSKIPTNSTSTSISSLTKETSNLSSPTCSSISTTVSQQDINIKKNLTETTNIRIDRIPRSIARSVGKNSTNTNNINPIYTQTIPISSNNNNNSNINLNDSINNNMKTVSKRGVSLSAVSSNKSTRSMSVNGDNETSTENLNESKYNADGTRNVKYVVRHKPKESKIKIFSQKLELKNVSSKIGSLENYDYKPGGGAIVIETKSLSWNAHAKIGSLDKANYTPSGGNVKIENRKLNWNAHSKIGSLERADYKPKGGNVKIESYKLNFKEKAKPKTDTGLVAIELKPKSSLNSSQCGSTENMNETQEIFS